MTPYSGTGLNLYTLLANWQQIGVYDIVLPFLLVFTISFAVLQKVKILGAAAKKMNIVVALVIALLFLQNSYLIFILQRFLPNMSIVMVAVLMFLLLVGIVGGQEGFKGFAGAALNVAFFLAIIVTLIALSVDFFPGANGNGILEWYYILFPDPGTQSTVLFIILIIVVVAIVSHEKPTTGGLGSKVMEDVKGAFGRKEGP